MMSRETSESNFTEFEIFHHSRTTYKFTVCSWTCVGEEDEDHDEHLFKEGDGVKTEGVVKKDEL